MFGTLIFQWETLPNPEYDPLGQMNGCFNEFQRITPAQITDGLSQTIFAADRAAGFLNRDRVIPLGRWTMTHGDTLLYGWHPPNRVFKEWGRGWYRTSLLPFGSASSQHSSGINVLMGDGSARFVKDTIESWPLDPVTLHPAGMLNAVDGFENVPRAGVWQALVTRSGGEVIGSGDY
jgi:prepilin-type processing-associated H-X9-DG protein